MSLIKSNGISFPTMSHFFDDFFNKDFYDWNNRNFSVTNTTLPAVNIRENEEGFLVEMAAPGMKKDEFKVELDNNMLTISSEKKSEKQEGENDNFTRKEFSYQSFTRSFTLPEIVNSEKIQAKYEDGVLKLMIPKKEEARPKPPKMIKIS